jgi:hypothetical protein
MSVDSDHKHRQDEQVMIGMQAETSCASMGFVFLPADDRLFLRQFL